MDRISLSPLLWAKRVKNKNPAKIQIKVDDHILLMGVGLSVLYWILEAALHTFILHEGSMGKNLNLFTLSSHEIWMRSMVIFLFMAFSFLARAIIAKRKRAEMELAKYRDHLEDLVRKRTFQLQEVNKQLQHEITERKQAEEAATVAYSELDLIFNASGDGMCVIDKELRLLRVNDTFCNMLGMSRDEVVGKACHEVFRHSLCNTADCPLSHILGDEERFEYELELIRADGRRFPVILTATPLRRPSGHLIGMVESFKDISDRKKREEELQRTQKLESIGILAGGIAHDFNNLMTTILGNISLGKLYARSGKSALRVLEEAERACHQAKSLTQQLLTFSKGGEPRRKATSLSKLIKETAAFVLSGSKTGCRLSLPDDLWWGEIDEGQIRQVISNLIINADQSMPDGGLIDICAENVVVNAEDNLPLKDGRYIKISIKDNGVGIPEGNLQKIFDPYFTTKQTGSGLGLAITYSIVKKHTGCITVKSELGVGSIFSVYLPASEREIFAVKELAEDIPYSGRGRILFMDDQRSVRDMVGETLTYLGYEVYCVGEGSEAIDLYKRAQEKREPFDVVILDLTIPGGMGGKDTVQELLKLDPQVKAIVTSGYSHDPIMADYRKYGFRDIIIKPFEIKELHRILSHIIGAEKEVSEQINHLSPR